MSDHPLARPLTRILNELRRAPRIDWDSLQEAVEEALAYTDVLETRLTTGFPLLAASAGAQDLRLQFEAALAGQRAVLRQLADVVAKQDLEGLGPVLPQLETAADRVAEVVTALRRLEEAMPQFSDIPLVNEILTLALHQLQGKGDFADDLLQRLPRLREFLTYLEDIRSGFVTRHPEEPELAQAFQAALEALRQSAGGMFIYLQEGRRPADLSNALTLFDRAMNSLGACFLAMRELEYDSLEYSEDPHLDRLRKAIDGLAQGKDTRAEIARHLEGLARFQRNLAADLAVLESRAFMPASLQEESVPRMVELLDRMDVELGHLHEPGAEASALREAAERFQALGEEYDRLQGELEDRLGSRPSLADSGHYDELVALMQGVFEGSVPDARLESKVQVLLALQEALRRRLALEQHRQPADAERIQVMLESLGGQQAALETLLEYLGSGQRGLLLVAYEQLLPPTQRLIEFKREAAAQEAEAGTPTVLCPFCATANEPGASRCSQCARPLPAVALGMARPAEVLDLYDSRVPGAQSAALSENFQYLLDVLDDAVAGILAPEEARDLLLPFWETVLMAEIRAQDMVRPAVAAMGDATLSSYQEELQALLAYLKETMSTLFDVLESHDLGSLSGLRTEVLEVADGLQRFHAEVQEAGRR